MRRILTTLALMAAVVAAPALAQANDDRLVKTVSLKDLQQVLTEEGYTITTTGGDGVTSVQATDEEVTGLIFHLIGTACNETTGTDCQGINMQVRYDGDGTETLERINDANLMWAATSTWLSKSTDEAVPDTVGITRYVILDGGMTVRNVKDNLANMLSIAAQVGDYVWMVGDYAEDDDW